MAVTARLTYDPTADSSSHKVGSYVLAGTDGTQIGSQNINSEDWLNVAAQFVDETGTSYSDANPVPVSGTLTVTEADTYAEDSPFTEGDTGTHLLTVRQNTLATSTSADGDYASIKSNALGEIYTTDEGAEALLTTIDADTGAISTNTATIAGDTTSIDALLTALSKAEDSAHVSGDQGFGVWGVRSDADTALAADGDYIPFSMNSSGHVRVNLASGTVSTTDAALANTAIFNEARAVSTTAIDTTAAAPIADRKYLWLANEGNKSLYWGMTGVTAANGFPLHPGMQHEARIGAAITPEVIGEASASSEDLRVMQAS